MGRLSCFFGIIALIVFSCSKDAANTSSGRELLGVWVDVHHPADSLLIYKEAKGLLVIDNSMAFRTNQSKIDAIPTFSSMIRLTKNAIAVARIPVLNTLPEFRSFQFKWIDKGKKFAIAGDAFRPFQLCTGCELTYARVK